MNTNWSRWIFASLTNHFNNYKQSVPFFVEGQIRDQGIIDFAEFRMDGPYINEINVGNWYIDVLPAILIQIGQSDDIHKLERIIGIFSLAFTKDIAMYRYGDSPDDDGTQFGCLTLSAKHGERIRIDKFGQTQAANRIAQASIEAHYTLKI